MPAPLPVPPAKRQKTARTRAMKNPGLWGAWEQSQLKQKPPPASLQNSLDNRTIGVATAQPVGRLARNAENRTTGRQKIVKARAAGKGKHKKMGRWGKWEAQRKKKEPPPASLQKTLDNRTTKAEKSAATCSLQKILDNRTMKAAHLKKTLESRTTHPGHQSLQAILASRTMNFPKRKFQPKRKFSDEQLRAAVAKMRAVAMK